MTEALAPIIVIAGPTGAGKTALAVRLAEQLQAEIISADSRQIYRHLDLGTGKPDAEQRRRVRHHLVSTVSPRHTLTATQYASLAESVFRRVRARKKRCLVVGGTGLWIRAFVDGLVATPAPDPDLRRQLVERAQQEGSAVLHQELARADPVAAARLYPADRARVIRALEIHYLRDAQPAEEPAAISASPKRSYWLGITRPRQELYDRAEARIDGWLAAGWVAEIDRLLASGIPAAGSAMQALGYSHLLQYRQGAITFERAVELMKRDTRRYIKRQLTWFQAESRMHWMDLSARGEDEVLPGVVREIEDWLG